MNKEKSAGENLTVHGDVNELDAIISTPGLISLDRNDIQMVLEDEGESFIVVGEADNLDEAIGLALKEIPLEKKVTSLAVAIWCGNPNFPMSEIASVNNALSEFGPEANIFWGVYTDSNLGDSFKVTIIATGTVSGEDISEIRRKIGCRNGLISRKEYETYLARSRKKTIELMRHRHAYYSKLINEAGVKTAKDFYDRFREHFSMYGIELRLCDDMSCSIYLELEDYDYEQYKVIDGKNDNFAEVSPYVGFKEMFCNTEVNIFEDHTL